MQQIKYRKHNETAEFHKSFIFRADYEDWRIEQGRTINVVSVRQTEQFEMNVSGKEYSIIHILSLEELEESGKFNTIVFLQNIEIPENEYLGEGVGNLYIDHTLNAFYAVREPVKNRYLFQISRDGGLCFDEEFVEISRKAAMCAVIEKYPDVHKVSLLEE